MALGDADIACIGDNCVDVYLDAIPAERAGGNAFNVALEMARAGYGTTYFGAVGDDARGRLIAGAARAAGVDGDGIQVRAEATGVTVVAHDAAGERRFVEEDYGAAAQYRISSDAAAAAAAHRWVHLARQPDAELWAGRLAAEGARLSADFGEHGSDARPDPLCAHLSVAFFSVPSRGEEAGARLAAATVDAGAAIAVVTLGSAGSIARSGERSWRQPAIPVDVVDTLGAGDAFIAGFVAALLDDEDIPTALRRGAQAGADACTRVGLGGSTFSEEVQA